MQRKIRAFLIFFIATFIFVSVPSISEDIKHIDNYLGNTKSSNKTIETFSIVAHCMTFTQNEVKSNSKLVASSFLDSFSIQSLSFSSEIAILNNVRTIIDFRKRIKETLSSRFYGSKYKLSSLFI